MEDLEASSSTPQPLQMRIPGGWRTAGRSHARTLDLLMRKLENTRGGDRAALFVCEMCFKYMTDSVAYNAHTVCQFCL